MKLVLQIVSAFILLAGIHSLAVLGWILVQKCPRQIAVLQNVAHDSQFHRASRAPDPSHHHTRNKMAKTLPLYLTRYNSFYGVFEIPLTSDYNDTPPRITHDAAPVYTLYAIAFQVRLNPRCLSHWQRERRANEALAHFICQVLSDTNLGRRFVC